MDFQVATIKPSPPDAPKHTQIHGNKFVTSGTTVLDVLLYAYNVHPSQIVGGPDWLRTAKFDLLADPETEAQPTSEEMKAMVGRLLGDRFHLVLKRERRELPVYALVRTGKDVKFKEDDQAKFPGATGGFVPPGKLVVRNGTVANFAAFLQRFAPGEITRPVVDQTGIAGYFDFDLRFTPVGAPVSADDTESAPGLFTAVQEQLGLRLEDSRAAVDVLVVESVARPSDN